MKRLKKEKWQAEITKLHEEAAALRRGKWRDIAIICAAMGTSLHQAGMTHLLLHIW